MKVEAALHTDAVFFAGGVEGYVYNLDTTLHQKEENVKRRGKVGSGQAFTHVTGSFRTDERKLDVDASNATVGKDVLSKVIGLDV